MTDILSRSIQQRADNSSRLSQLISATKGKQFEQHQEDIENQFNDQVNKYTSKVNEFVQEKLQDKEEAVNAIISTPMAYSFGKKSTKNAQYLYNNSDKIKTKVLDDIKKAQKVKDDIADKISGKVTELREGLQQKVDAIKNATNSVERVRANPEEWINSELDEGLLGGGARPPIPSPSMEPMTETSIHRNIQNNPETNTNVAEREQPQDQEMDEIQRTPRQTAPVDEEIAPVSQGENLAVNASEDIGKTVVKDVAGDVTKDVASNVTKSIVGEAGEAIAIAPEVFGVAAGAGALGYGLYELFSHHGKRPTAPIRQTDVNRPISTPYNIQANILATSGSNLQRGSYSF